MTTRTPDPGDEPTSPPAGPSRLDREVAEILERAEREPISFEDAAARRRKAPPRLNAPEPRSRPAAPTRSALQWFEGLGAGRYLVLAVVAAILALLVSDLSPLLANVFAIVCVAAIFIPVVERFRRPDASTDKMWRGQNLGSSLSRPAGIERLFDRFRRPPRI